MKRTISVLLSILLFCFLAACGSRVQDNQSNPVGNQEQEESSTPKTENSAAPNSENLAPPETLNTPTEAIPQESAQEEPMSEPVTKLKIEVGGHSFTATLEQNDATAALMDMLPLTISMSDYFGTGNYCFSAVQIIQKIR